MNLRVRVFSVSFSLTAALAVVANLGFVGNVSGQITQVTGSPQTNTTTSTTLTITKPSGLAVGDVMFANIMQTGNDANSLSNATLSGWTVIAGSNMDNGSDRWRGTLLYKVALASDVSATNFAFSLDADSDDGQGAIVAFSGVDVTGGVTDSGASGGPFDVDPGSTYTGINTDNTFTSSAITTASANAAVIMFGITGDNQSISNWSTTNPGTLTELYDVNFNVTLDMGVSAAWALKSATGSTGTGTATISNSVSNGSILIALKACAATANAGANQEVCAGGTINLSGSIGGTASSSTWSAPSGSFSNASSLTSTYTPSITSGSVVLSLTTNDPDGAGPCTAAVSTMTVTVKPVPTTTGVTICQGGSSGSLTVTSACGDINGSEGPSFAGSAATGGGAGSAWSNTGNISADDGSVVTNGLNSGESAENLHVTNFGFSIPSGATITGITVAINRWGSSTSSGGIQESVVQLVKNGTTPVGENKASTGVNWPTSTATVASYGGSSDTWMTTWTPAEINASTFGVTLDVFNANVSSGRTASVDYVQITVNYTIDQTISWYTVSSGGTAVQTESSLTTFNPVGDAQVLAAGAPYNSLNNTNTPGTYTFWAECSLNPGCRTATNFVINASPSCSVSGPDPVCANTTGHVYSAPMGMSAYAWSIAGNGTIPGSTTGQTVSVNAGAAGTYTVTLTVTSSGCTSSCSKTVTVNALPTASISGTLSFCTGGSTTLTASGGTSYLWDDNSTNAMRPVNAAGTYTVQVTDANGCTDTETATVTVSPIATADAGGPYDGCGTSPVSIMATASGAGSWSGGLGAFGSATSTSTTYTPHASEVGSMVMLTWTTADPDGAGPCTLVNDNATLTVGTPATADAGGPYTTCGATPVAITATASGPGMWSGGSGTFANATSASTTYTPVMAEFGTTVTLYWTTNDPDGVGGCPAVTDNASLAVSGQEIEVEGNGMSITDGDVTPVSADYTDFGWTTVAAGTITRTFSIKNSGSSSLTLTGGTPVTLSGSGDFSVTMQPSSPLAAAGDMTMFQIQFDPSSAGMHSATVSIANNDCDEAPFTFDIQGKGTIPQAISVFGSGSPISNRAATASLSDDTDFGSTGGMVSHTFTIYNVANGSPLAPLVTIADRDAADFTVTAQPASLIDGGGSTTFTIKFQPSATGLRTAQVIITHNDLPENPFVFTINGTGL